MGYDHEDAWNELKGIFHASKSNEETEAPLSEWTKEWIRNKKVILRLIMLLRLRKMER